MSLVQFFRILIARRWMIATALAASLVGAFLIIVIFPPRYVATSRVMLELLKPDPVTGAVMGNGTVRAYVQTQTELIRDYNVASRAVDLLGWTNDPGLVERFGGDPGVARHRLAELLIANTDAEVLAQSNILEIKYTSTSAEAAKGVADAIRHAYIDVSLAFKQNSARENAAWFDNEAAKARRQLAIAQETKSTFEREHGLVMQADKTDVDSARLAALSGQMQVGTAVAPVTPVTSPSAAEVARLDAQIAALRKTLGDNNPSLRLLEQQRSALAQQAAQEKAAAGSASAAAVRVANENSAAAQRALQNQKAKVLANRESLTKLTQLQDDVDLLRDRYNKASARAGELRMQGNVADSGITPLGNAISPEKPSFPNIPLILGAASGFGIFLGVFAALLVELLNRRVRLSRDLEDAVEGVPLLAVIGSKQAAPEKGTWFGGVRRRLFSSGVNADEAVAA